MPLTPAERLEAEHSLTAEALGMSEGVFDRRLVLWEEVAGERTDATESQRQAHVASLALGAWIAYLLGQADKFRSEGQITVEQDILGRVALLREQQGAAQAQAGLVAPAANGPVTANPAPIFEPWGVG
ncbi:hypothetical protein QOL99_00190 [Deinococcus sp. MIMF12]|uniref:Uncharacterized protein n=1 Tax=Deinococcus rhizophilus TaxID=3049544 RepID=A0ABT7JBZ9_9DEIO|nr:hypothetical protein [Deinococcus rhizophilus]MDL2342567.1 hypothetical protein [Deinococcus rhizophilus]